MKYDCRVERMPDYQFDHPRQDDKLKKIWQVVMKEVDETGRLGKVVRVVREGLTWEEGVSVAEREKEALRKAEQENLKK